jgi:hypothetical protein
MIRDRVDVRVYDGNRRDIWDKFAVEERVNFHPELLPLRLFSSCSLKLQLDPNVAAAAAESDSACPGIGIVISHMYPAEVQC